jgi:hypothetical protein
MGEINVYNIFVGKPEGKLPLRRSRRRWENNMRMGLREIVLEVVDWIHLAQKWDWWRALDNTMNFGFHRRREIPRLPEWLPLKKESAPWGYYDNLYVLGSALWNSG